MQIPSDTFQYKAKYTYSYSQKVDVLNHTHKRSSFENCSNRLHYRSYDLVLQPKAFRVCVLRQILPAVPLFPSFVGTFQDEVSFRLQFHFPEDLVSVSVHLGPKPFVSLRPCDPIVERTFPVSIDLLSTRDWSGTRFPSLRLRLS
jgi:hypothetical protein